MNTFLGINELFDYQLYIKAILITLYAILIFRVNSSRIFGNFSSLDLIINIILGAILGEVIVSNLPFLPAIITCTLIVILHRFLAYACYKSHFIGSYIKGKKIVIIQDAHFIQKNLAQCHLTHHDILQSLRVQHGLNDIKTVKKGILERSGEISFLLDKA